ncbi:MAG: hypothetical protein AAF687_14390 [Pseudomonadota bacterium]
MTRVALFSAAAAMFITPAAMAQDEAEKDPVAEAEVTGEAEAEAGYKPVKLVSWDGDWQFLKTSRRMRVWRPAVSYTLDIDETGAVSGCKIKREFDRTLVNMKLCKVLTDHHQFEPARDANDVAVQGSYSARLVYADLRKK